MRWPAQDFPYYFLCSVIMKKTKPGRTKCREENDYQPSTSAYIDFMQAVRWPAQGIPYYFLCCVITETRAAQGTRRTDEYLFSTGSQRLEPVGRQTQKFRSPLSSCCNNTGDEATENGEENGTNTHLQHLPAPGSDPQQ